MKKLFTLDIEKAIPQQPKYGYGKKVQAVTVSRGGKVFQRQQQVGRQQQLQNIQQHFQQKEEQPTLGTQHLVTGKQPKVSGSLTVNIISALAHNSDLISAGMMGAEMTRSIVKNKKLTKNDAADIMSKYTGDLTSLATKIVSKGSEKLTGHPLGEDEKQLVASVGHKMLNLTLNRPENLRQKFWMKALKLMGRDPQQAFKEWNKKGMIKAFSDYASKKAVKMMLESKELSSMMGGKSSLRQATKYVSMGKYGNLSDKQYKQYQNQAKSLSNLIRLVGQKNFLDKHTKPGMFGKFTRAVGDARIAHLYLKNLSFAGRETMGILNDVGIKVPKTIQFIAKHPIVPIAGYKANKFLKNRSVKKENNRLTNIQNNAAKELVKIGKTK